MKNKMDQNGECPIYLFINQPGQRRKRISTRYKCTVRNWNVKKQRLKGTTSIVTSINAELDKMVLKITELGIDYYRKGIDINSNDIKKAITEDSWQKSISPIDFFSQEMEKMKFDHRDSTLKAYKTTFNYFIKYKPKGNITWSTFDDTFDSVYTNYLKSHPSIQSDATIGKHIKVIKALLNKAYTKGLIKSDCFRKYKVFKAESTVPSLEMSEIDFLWNSLEKLNENDKTVLLAFLFLCETSLRIGEAMSLKWEDVDGYFLQIYELKNDKSKRPYLSNNAKYILQYFRDLESSKPIPIKTTFNRQIKIIAKRLGLNRSVNTSIRKNLTTVSIQKPLHKVISSRIGRRTYTTISLKNNVPLSIIQRNTGHANLEVLQSYNRLTDNMVIDFMQNR